MIVCLLIILFADYYLLTFKRQICHAFSEREQVQLQRTYVIAHDGEMGKRLLTATVKAWRVWQGRQMLPFVAATTCKLLLEIYV